MSSNGASPSPPDLPAECLFFTKLPLEVRNAIYRLAYVTGDKKDFNVIFKDKWYNDEWNKSRGSSWYFYRRGKHRESDLPFPDPPMHSLLVNRRYYREASEEWFRNTMIYIDHRSIEDFCSDSPAFRSNVFSLAFDWETAKTRSLRNTRLNLPPQFAKLKHCKNLRLLKLVVHENVFKAFPKVPWKDTYTKDELLSLLEVHDLLAIQSLTQILLKPRSASHDREPLPLPPIGQPVVMSKDERERWESNVAQLQEVMNTELNDRDSNDVLLPGNVPAEEAAVDKGPDVPFPSIQSAPLAHVFPELYAGWSNAMRLWFVAVHLVIIALSTGMLLLWLQIRALQN